MRKNAKAILKKTLKNVETDPEIWVETPRRIRQNEADPESATPGSSPAYL